MQGIDTGADDYVAKPFRMEELIARLRGLIRRASGQVTSALRCGAVTLDTRAAKVTREGTAVRLTSHEFRVLSYLMHHRGRVVSQAELTEHIYAQAFDRDSNTAGPGSGFGLAIVRDLADVYGGSIALDRSTSLGGLRAKLTLPAAQG